MTWNASHHENWEMSELDKHLDGEEPEWPPVYLDLFDRYHDTDTGRFVAPLVGQKVLEAWTAKVGAEEAKAGLEAFEDHQWRRRLRN